MSKKYILNCEVRIIPGKLYVIHDQFAGQIHVGSQKKICHSDIFGQFVKPLGACVFCDKIDISDIHVLN